MRTKNLNKPLGYYDSHYGGLKVEPKTWFNWCGYRWTNEMEGGRIIHPNHPQMYYDIQYTLAILESNVLSLNTIRKPKKIKYWDGREFDSEFAVPTLKSVQKFTYGTFEIEAVLPKATREGLWPSIWLTGAHAWPPEIDIAECWTKKNGGYLQWNNPHFPWIWPKWNTTTNAHYLDLDYDQKLSLGSLEVSALCQTKNPAEQWIKYSCRWTPTSIEIFYNNILVRKITDKNVMNYFNIDPYMYFIFNIWIDDGIDGKGLQSMPMYVRNFKYQPL